MDEAAVQRWLVEPGGLAARLAEVRRAAGFNGRQFAAAAGWHQSKVSKIEYGTQIPSQENIDTWATVCGCDGATRAELRTLLERVLRSRRALASQMRNTGMVPLQETYSKLMADATLVSSFEVAYVPGLLQTPDYTRAILTAARLRHGLIADDVDAAVLERVDRQKHLYDPSRRFEILITPVVMGFMACTPEQMRVQLHRLLAAIGQSNVRFGVMPVPTLGRTPPQVSFHMYDDALVVREDPVTEDVIADPSHVAAYRRLMDALWAQSVEGDEARAEIVAAIDRLPKS